MPTYEHPRPALTADIVALAHGPAGPVVLLVRRAHEPFEGRWALPGGFVDEGEIPEAAARRELEEETGLRVGSPLSLVGVYGEPGRDPRGWTVSAAYLVVLDEPAVVLGGDDAAEAVWMPVTDLPGLAFDHDAIVRDALAAAGELTPRGSDRTLT
jgi:8-oxo-dGTP diphosphatase